MLNIIPMRLLSITLIVLSLLGFSSCTTYQYITLDSFETVKDTSKSFTWENDTLQVAYNFNGKNGPVAMTLANKLDKPLYVNWKKSALIRDGQAFSLMDRNVLIDGAFASSSVGGKVYHETEGGFAGALQLPANTDLIPPGAHITRELNAVVAPSPVYSAQFADEVQTPTEKGVLPTGDPYKYKRYTFDQSSSPLQFKSFLTLMVANSTQEFFVSHSFYAREVLISKDGPWYFGFYKPDGDKLFVAEQVAATDGR